MKICTAIFFLLVVQICSGQVVLNSDGPGNTYELITSVLAPGHNPIEVPDCNHNAFGEHIDEVFDDELNTNVFRFYIHTTPDNDRCINLDRQRNEIKSYSKSPDNLLGIDSEKVIYKWKFKLEEGFQSSPNFTHVHQLKSVGGSFESIPMYTLTTRKGNPDKLELRYAETDDQITLKKVDIAPFIGNWVEVTETIEYGITGTYEIEIKKFNDQSVLFSYSNNNIVNWRLGAEFVRPKWGIYRSLINAQDLRDEAVLFADFSIEEIEVSNNQNTNTHLIPVYQNPINNKIVISNSGKINAINIFDLQGKKVLHKKIDSNSEIIIDVSEIIRGPYVLNLIGLELNHAQLIIISNK